MTTAYQRRKDRERERQSEQARAGKDIAADYPQAKKAALRKRLAKSLLAFCKHCMKEKFGKKFSKDHLKAIAKMERAILEGGNFALAMPRGSGKTTLTIAAALWALLNGHKRYLAVIGADKRAAAKLLSGVRVELETNDELLDLYPDACYPIRCLERIANRCKGQTFNGSSTYIEWTAEKIAFATIPNAAISGAVIEVCGIMGGVRGMQHTTPNGETIRPDMFIVDDPQTNKSARSATMVEQRLETITGTCPGLAGPGEEISGFCLCTVIEEDDVADQLLDPEKFPEWQGERFQLIYQWPKNEDLWEEYGILWREGMAAGVGFGKATAFYRKHMKAMREGARVAWDERKTKKEIDALQHVFNLLLKLGDAFWKECQNQPKSDDENEDLLSVAEIQAKANGFKREKIPTEANLLTAFIDVHDRLLYWMVLAVRSSDFSSWVIDYGAWPEQVSPYYSMSSVNKTLSKKYPKAGKEARVRAGCLDLIDWLVSEKQYTMHDSTTQLKLSRIGLDAAWESRVMQNVALESKHSAIVLPRFGRGVRAEDAPFELWKPKPGERRGVGWKIRVGEGGGRYGLLDTNYWKNFTHARLGVATGDPGSLSFFHPGKRLTTHRMLAEHCRAERRVEDKTNERTLQIWKEKSNKPDNHLFDCLVGSVAMAAIEGAALKELRVSSPKQKRRRQRRVVRI